VIQPQTLYSVPAGNYTFASEAISGGRQCVGSLDVADGRQVGFYVMDAANFSLWRVGRPASVILANPNALSYNFTFSTTASETYYFVFSNQENSPVTLVFTLSSVQDITTLNPFVEYAGYELLLLGIVLSFFGLRGGRKRAEEKKAPQAPQSPQPVETGWKCKFCGTRNIGEEPTFCSKCGRAQN